MVPRGMVGVGGGLASVGGRKSQFSGGPVEKPFSEHLVPFHLILALPSKPPFRLGLWR